MQLVDLKNVEIFRTGIWNGDKYTVSDLDEMVANFDKVGYKPPVKVGHAEESGTPAYGWVENLRRVGDKLVADFTSIPEKIADAIKQRMFDTVSAEIFFNLKRNGQLFKRALKAVALLGAEIPAVAGLAPLSKSVDFSGVEAEAVNFYELPKESTVMPDELKVLQDQIAALTQRIASFEQAPPAPPAQQQTAPAQQQQQAAPVVSENAQAPAPAADDSALKVRHLQEQLAAMQGEIEASKQREKAALIAHKVDDLRIPALREHVRALYTLAMDGQQTVVKFTVDDKQQDVSPVAVVDDLVKRLNSHSEKLFRELGQTGGLHRDDQPREEDPSAELDRLARAYAAKHNSDYGNAYHAVLNDPANADLKRSYALRR